MVDRHIVLHKNLKDGNDLEEWMPMFKTCAMANDWNAEAKSKSPMQPFRGTSNGVLSRDAYRQIMNRSIYSKSAQEDVSMWWNLSCSQEEIQEEL